ncbi:MAG: cycloartenol synthase [Verrucomicrobiales bacterium]|nr:cycloartenol synthase [Verrucomicrobiales bacterium]
MKRLVPATSLVLSSLAAIVLSSPAHAQEKKRPAPGDSNVSLKLEIERAIERGVDWLKKQQNAETGAWSDATHPALTALPIMAILGDPNRDPAQPLPAEVKKGYDYILSTRQVDGGLYTKGLATYNTALSLTALSLSGEKDHLPVIAKARRLLINQQQDFDKRGQTDNLLDGGIGYGGTYAHSDLSNTHLALEALYYSKKALADTEFDETKEFDLDWDAAIEFVSRCQNSEATTKLLGDTVGLRKEDQGGFVYFPGDTKSDEIDLGNGRVALRSYGSMSYAGLLSFIYAEMSDDDPRVVAVREWLSKNYTLAENPGMDAQGLFYYYHTMSKALATSRTGKIALADGRQADWKQELAVALFNHQQPDGSWINKDSSRWMEDNPVLVTAYALLALEHAYRTL